MAGPTKAKPTHKPFELRYHNAMPDWAKVIGLRIKAVPEHEGGGFAVAKDQAALIAAAPATAASHDRLLAALENLTSAIDIWGTGEEIELTFGARFKKIYSESCAAIAAARPKS